MPNETPIRVSRVDFDEDFREAYIDIDFGTTRFTTSAESVLRRDGWSKAMVHWQSIGATRPADAERCTKAILFACQLARRIDAGEVIDVGEEYRESTDA